MNTGRTARKIALALSLLITVSMVFAAANAQEESLINADDIYSGLAMIFAPGGQAIPELIQARLVVFVILIIILVPLMSKIPMFES